MTSPEVDQELERLFSVARKATAPEVGARERIRAGLMPRLLDGTPALRRAWGRRTWLGLGLAALGVGAVALWLTSAPPVVVGVPAAQRAAPAPDPTRAVAPPAAPASAGAPATTRATSPSAEPLRSPPSAAASKPIASTTVKVDPAEELPLVRAMQQALRAGNPSHALTLAGDHARRFPHGTLAEEREGVRAVARCQLAAPVSRPAILEAFSQRFASSPYAARVKAACQ